MDDQFSLDIQQFSLAERLVQIEGMDAGYLESSLGPDDLDETKFLREFAWVVLSSGFRERVVRKIFSNISLCFCDWSSSYEINSRREICIMSALDVFRFKRKIVAIADGARIIHRRGFECFKVSLFEDTLTSLRELPFIGPVTVFHLAKNIGFGFAKPDRHLVRLSAKHGYQDANEFCTAVAGLIGCSVPYVDTVLWRLSEMGRSDSLFLPSVVKQAFSTNELLS